MRGRDVASERMRNSGLIGTPFESAADVVRRHGAMQAQDYGPAKWSIGQRARDLVDTDVDTAIADGSVVRTHVLRPTWHFVAREDVRWLLSLTGPRVQQKSSQRYRELGLDARTLARCERIVVRSLEGGNHLTRDEVAAALHAAKIDTSGQRLPWILMHCELEAVISSGARSGRHHTYALLDERVPPDPGFDRDDALAELVRRYLDGHGPATTRDVAWWSSLPLADIRTALHALGSEVRSENVEGLTLWSIASAAKRTLSALGVHLLQPYDELVVGYTESRYVGDPGAAAALAAWRDRRLPNGVVLVNGGLGGHWRRTVDRSVLDVEVRPYEALAPADARALDAELRRLSRFVGLPVSAETRPL